MFDAYGQLNPFFVLLWAGWIVLVTGCMTLASKMAVRKGRHPRFWAVLTMAFGLPVLALLWCLPVRRRAVRP